MISHLTARLSSNHWRPRRSAPLPRGSMIGPSIDRRATFNRRSASEQSVEQVGEPILFGLHLIS